jgi:hypothetical protein
MTERDLFVKAWISMIMSFILLSLRYYIEFKEFLTFNTKIFWICRNLLKIAKLPIVAAAFNSITLMWFYRKIRKQKYLVIFIKNTTKYRQMKWNHDNNYKMTNYGFIFLKNGFRREQSVHPWISWPEKICNSTAFGINISGETSFLYISHVNCQLPTNFQGLPKILSKTAILRADELVCGLRHQTVAQRPVPLQHLSDFLRQYPLHLSGRNNGFSSQFVPFYVHRFFP